MRCHYEVLGVERDADDGVLKTVYRKAALQWHPDKNQHRLEEADVRFKELQNAYEVLSDKHERAWYDSHRDAILRSGETHQAGGDGGVTPGQRPSDELDPFQYFSTACYSGYNDGAKGFYTVYSTVFKKLAEEERQAAAAQSDQQDKDTASNLPAFGSSCLAGPQVAAFYSVWLNYTTVKDFAWADKYNPAAAPNRKVRRLMEEDNKKERKSMKRVHNDAVRELVAFVRKRDKRLAAHQAEEAKRRMEKEEQDRLRREEEKQERLQRALDVQEADWLLQGGEEANQEEEEEESIPDDLYCPLCDKSFKSQKALANHERSKQHLKAVETLRAELEEEEQALDGSEGSGAASLPAADSDTDDVGVAVEPPHQLHHPESEIVQDAEAAESEQHAAGHQPPPSPMYAAETQPSRKKSKKQKKKQKQQQAQMAAAGQDSEEEQAAAQAMHTHHHSHDGEVENDAAHSSQDGEQDILERMMEAANISQSAVARGAHQAAVSAAQQAPYKEATSSHAQHQSAPGPSSQASDQPAGPSPHEGLSHEQYKKLKRHKKKNQPAKADANEVQFSTSCATCGLDCKSRNKLFTHLKTTGHAALK